MRNKLSVLIAAVGFLGLAFVIFQRQQPAPLEPRTQQTPVAASAETPVQSATSAAPAPSARAGTGAQPRSDVAPLPPRDIFWQLPASEPAFSRFTDWANRYESAAAPAKATLESEGVVLARERLAALANLIEANPERALQLAVPAAVRGAMPGSVRALLEEPVNAVGDLAVMGTMPLPGQPAELPAVFRTATVNGELYHVFTHGQGLRYVTKNGVPLNGIAVPESAASRAVRNPLARASRRLALDPSPGRVLEQSGIADIQKARGADPVCSVSGQSWEQNNTPTAVEIGGTVFTLCGAAHLRDYAGAVVAAAGLDMPGGAAGGLPTAESSYTEGRKRMFLMRPYWSDHAVAMTTNSALTHWVNFSNYMFQMSYGKLRFAPLGQGSDISTELLIPGSVNSYIAGLGNGPTDAWKAVKDVASTNYGYNLGQYDFLYYVTDGAPSAGYCGLGFVGGVGFHLANNCFDAAVSSHEYGHNLDLNHANFWDTAQQSIIGTGQNVEYGDGNDPMGGGGNPNQFNARYKNHVGWITNTDIATIPATGSNRYRLNCFDLDYGVGLRGLKFARTGSQNYWINFRQRKTGSPALMNGVELYWTGNGNGSSYLLDVRLKGGSGDNAVVIGRTFSDPALNFHFTPVGKGNTYPESIDIVAVTGSQPGNLPPVVALSASTLTPGTGQSVAFSASASDPNGDTLAYYWEFGDGLDSYSANNQPVQSHSYASAGEYTVRCMVSDMRGGTTQRSLIVRVGNPTVFRISGHVLRQDNRPLAGVRVSVSGSRYAYTEEDGSYTVAGLTAGSYTLSCIEPVSGSLSFTHPFFVNPVTVGPSRTNLDFIIGTSAPPVTLLAAGSAWKYLDDGSDQGTAWIAPTFSDLTWSNGPAQLGYGEGDEATVISYGPDANNKPTTSYFRRSFVVANPSALTNFTLNVLRDDGAIVYLNGTVVYRGNMPTGVVNYATFASTSVDDQDFFFTNVPPSLVLAGANVFAVEIHQADLTSSDVSFDLSLTAQNAGSAVQGIVVTLTTPAIGSTFTTPTNVALEANISSIDTTFTNMEFFAGAVKIGEDAAQPYMLTWNNPSAGAYSLSCVAVSSGGIRRTSPAVAVTVTLPPTPPVAMAFFPTGSVWSYFFTNVGAPAGWQNPASADDSWRTGPARIGFNTGNTGLGTILSGDTSAVRFPAAYFRRAFTVNDPAAVTNLTLQLARDDGAVVWLNGVEVLRDNITNGVTPTYSMFASNAADSGGTYFTFSIAPGALMPGTNVVGVEVHQSSATSSDLIFDLGLSGLASTNRARGCWLVTSASGGGITLPGSAVLTAQVVAGGTLGVTNVEFYSDDVLIGQDATSPYAFTWNNPPGGAHALVAVAYDSSGASIASAPVNITVTAAPAGDALISFGDVWKYSDEGLNLGATWTAGGYNDSLWSAGPGRLGYGGDGETTTVSYGTNANFKYVTTYFRRKIVVPSPAAYSGLLLRLIRDDGAVVYINGVEVCRTNLQAGPVSYHSLALAGTGGADETTPIDVLLGTAGLVAGTNTIAVEMHQDAITSSDLGFDLALVGLRNTNTADGIYITGPGNNTHYNTPASVALAAYAASASGAVTLVEYFEGAVKVGQGGGAPYAATWTNPPAGIHSITAVATDSAARKMTSAPVAITVGSAPPVITPVLAQFINWGGAWSYWDNAGAVSNGWQNQGFDDSAWPVGNGRFGWGLDGEATLLTAGRIAHYFRRSVVITNGGALDSLTFNALRDDGVVVYLNGQEVFRTNMPAGAVGGATLASATVNTPDETIPVVYTLLTAGSPLLHGTNLIAVELHQSSVTSSDAGFDLNLHGEGTTEPRVYLTTPVNGATLVAGSPVTFYAQAQAGTGRALAAVEFFDNGVSFGSVSNPPYRLTWSGAPGGTNILFARTVDNLGHSMTSAPVQVFVGYQTVSLVLIPSNSVWRYLDNGSNQGTNWAQPAYSDLTWSNAPGQFGYGGNGEETTVGFGPSAGAKYITTYFRHTFVVPPGTFITNLTFQLVRDDGAVVWLNGRETYRSNMPLTAITYSTLASSSIPNGAEEQTFYSTVIASTNAVPGTNVVAVEIHQSAANSSDMGFNLQLIGSGYIYSVTPPVVASTLAGGGFQLNWPAPSTGWNLYSSPQLSAGAVWQLVNAPVVSINGQLQVTVPASNAAAFFRLQKL